MPLTDQDLRAIKDLIVDPVCCKVDDLACAMREKNTEQDRAISEHGIRLGKLETNQRRALIGWAFIVAVTTAAYHWVAGWVKKKMGWG